MTEEQKRKELLAISTNGPDMALLAQARSRTDPPAPEQHRQEKERSHLHQRLHSSSLRHRPFAGPKEKDNTHHHLRHTAKETVQSAIELRPPISFDTLLRRDKRVPETSSPNVEHRQPDAAELRAQRAAEEERRQVKPEQVQRAKQDNEKREEALRASLKDVEEVAMSSTRQLDDTYYSILEKASLLRSTVISLQQLADESRRMHSQFQQDSEKLEQDSRATLAGFGHFDDQEKRIDSLVRQLVQSKSKTEELNGRLDAARDRVAAFEERENKKQTTSRKRWGIAWFVLFGLVALVVSLVVARHRSAAGSRLHRAAMFLEAAPIVSALRPLPSPSEDPYLKQLFDDL